ncbi:MAG TPA: hypothetical protein VNQ73_20940 [Ilumatobacter sp.]|nr:hypothetical protein [Ilumatobacter sp.]
MPDTPPATSNDAEFRQSLVAAVQAELQRHAANLGAEIERLRQEVVEDRAQMRREVQGQLGDLARIVEEVQSNAEANLERARAAFEARVVDSESRNARRLDDVTAGLSATVQAAARPILADAAADHERATARMDGLEGQLRKFDEQAARMVTYVSEAIQRTEARQVELATEVQERVAAEVSGMRPLVDEIDSSVRRFQSEISSQVSTRINDAEDRFNTRVMAAEARMKEAAGTQIAEIQAHVGRVNANIDETLAVLNNRHDLIDDRFVATDRTIAELAESVKGVDSQALDEMANKVSAAVGEAMLVRIEMERLEKSVNGRTDELIVRVTEVETQLVDATMDVSTAIQLDRLEELERAVLELDPSRFVAYDPSSAGLKRSTPPAPMMPAPPSAGPITPDLGSEPKRPEPEGPEPEGPEPVAADSEDSLNGSSAVAEELPEPTPFSFAPPVG